MGAALPFFETSLTLVLFTTVLDSIVMMDKNQYVFKKRHKKSGEYYTFTQQPEGKIGKNRNYSELIDMVNVMDHEIILLKSRLDF